ncbi:glyoxalase-like domain protein [Leptospira mtsangambouensis]|uniref:Glyoxalase-like domain protein n=1 Tax=Leptospira mtsangambouensis TaxID=2484912 RepID=A0ABY2NZ70_9LEPT|nr:VOC family protein [Leptospira mtsangambouensis]TGM74466.1 glyoxalase-like domain protein [Leptospira mtsangambouensis]
MKKTLSVFGVLLAGILIWSIGSDSKSNYRKLDNSDFLYATVIMNSKNPEKLFLFYQNTFGAILLENVTDWNLTENKEVYTLRTSGYAEEGPSLTIFKSKQTKPDVSFANDLGYAHICFESDNVPGLIKRIRSNGGKIISTFDDLEKVPAVYAADPDGNIFEVHLPFPTPVTPKTIYRTLNSLIRTNLKLSPPENDSIRFLHVNINSKDWVKTIEFYNQVLNTQTTGFERDYSGDFIKNLTGVNGAIVKGKHVVLPGYSDGGPTFEVFTYNESSSKKIPNQFDLGRVATGFYVQNLNNALEMFTKAGGSILNQKNNEWALLKDLDGNLIVYVERKTIKRD